jgi:hypothetical protein
MRFRYLLPATLLVAGSALGQSGATNAIGVWNSSLFGFIGWYIGLGFPAGSLGNSLWQTLPAELTTHFVPTTGYGTATSRALVWRGYECNLATFSTTNPPLDGPRVQIRSTVINPAQTQRWLPDFTPGGLFVDMPSIPGIVAGGGVGQTYRISAVLGAPAIVPAGSTTGGGLAWVYQDFQTQLGDSPTAGFFMVSSSTESTSGGASSLSYSGFSSSGGLNGLLPLSTGEFVVTHLMENAVIGPIKNATIVTAGGQILGGGGPPAPFTVQYDGGRGAIHAATGDTLAYNGNSRLGNPVQGVLGLTYFTPFVLFSGDLGPGDPVASFYGTGEVWNTGPLFVYGSPLRSWIDDFCVISGACPVGTGAIVNPANSSWALWEGIDLIAGALNFNVLVNGLAFADVSAGPSYAGPTTVAFDSAAAPLGLMARNATTGTVGYQGVGGVPITTTAEHATILNPQAGYTPAVVGKAFGTYPGGLTGNYFATQCWMMDLSANQVVAMTNAAVIRLQ